MRAVTLAHLEMLFLELTGDQQAGHEGTSVGLGKANGGPASPGREGLS